MCLQEFQKQAAADSILHAAADRYGQLDLERIATCVICVNLMQEPTTMQCGHSFCRLCTIKWCVEYRHLSCPVCRHRLDRVLPSVNVTLKSLIEQLRRVAAPGSEQPAETPQRSSVGLTRPLAAVDHSGLLRKVSSGLDASVVADGKHGCSNSGTLSRLDLTNAPVYLFFAFWGFILFYVLSFFKRVLK